MVTMQDIANHAKVSRRTVSCVLSGKYKQARISEATKDKILFDAEKLGYTRNALATAIKTGKTNVIGFVGGLYNSYCMEIIRGINDIVSKNNYMIKLLSADTMEDIKHVARQCVEQRLAGVICRSLSEEDLDILQKELKVNNIPIVLVDSSFSHDWCSRVISDDFEGAKQATEYLLKLGHRKICLVTNSLCKGFSKIRYEGYTEAMKKWNIGVESNNICVINARDKDEIYDEQRNEIKDFLKSRKPTAIFCASDPLAMRMINIVSQIGIKVPDDLSIVGFADLQYTAFYNPALTTIKQPFAKMGRKASEILLSEIKEKSAVKEVKMPVELIIRASTTTIK